MRETGRSCRSPEGVKGRGQREALRSPRIPGQRSAGRYEDPNEAGNATSELCEHRRPEGLEWRAHGAKRSAQPRNTAQASAQAGAKTPMKQGVPQASSASIGGPKGWSGEHTEQSAVRSHGTPRKRQRRAVRRCGTTIANCGKPALPSTRGCEKTFVFSQPRSIPAMAAAARSPREKGRAIFPAFRARPYPHFAKKPREGMTRPFTKQCQNGHNCSCRSIISLHSSG